MRKTLLNRIKRILKNRRLRRMMTRFISVFAAFVVFVTTYALVLPAITMEREADCGIEAHQHDDSCYELQLVCDIPEDPGHQHDDSCYRAESVLKCVTAEHTHGEACFDGEGNLTCEQVEHVHDASCYEEERELICGLEESAGHQHDASCYENVLVCGKEVHVHSEACYHQDPVEEEEEYSEEYDVPEEEQYFEEEAYPEEAQEISEEVPAGISEDEEAEVPAQISADADPYETDGSSDAEAGEAGAARQDGGGSRVQAGFDPAQQGGADAGGSTADLAQAASPETPDAAPYVPELDPLDFRALLNSHTGIYYYPVQPGEIVENSAEITDWKKVTADTELGENDLLRVYLAYTVPAGAVNTTNETVRYRLPENLHLTDEQVKAINGTENGIAAQYVDYSTLTVTDLDNYHKYLGAEAVEGSRTPDQDQEAYLAAGGADGNGQEFISAVVRVENIWDSNSGELVGQDLLFTFVPYTVFKNRHEYDSGGQQTKTGLKVRGWFSLDFNMSQVDFEEPFADGDREILSAGVIFAAEDREEQIEEIRTDLRVVRAAETGAVAEENPEAAETEDPEDPETADASVPEEKNTENAEDTQDGSESGENTEEENKAPENDEDKNDEDGKELIKLFDEDSKEGDKNDAGQNSEKDPEKDSEKETPAVIMPAMSFEDSIRVSTGRPAGAEARGAGGTVADAADALPKKAKVTVRVEADEGTFPAGTTMVLAAVKDMETIAETVRDTVENGSAAGTDSGSADEGKASGSGKSADSTGSTDSKTAGTGNLKTYGFQAVDISFHDADGTEIEPAKPVRVAMTSEIVDQVRQEQQEDPGTAVADPVVVHIDDNGNVETMDLIAPEEIEPAQGRTEEELREEAEAEAAAKRAKEEAEAEAEVSQETEEAEKESGKETEQADKPETVEGENPNTKESAGNAEEDADAEKAESVGDADPNEEKTGQEREDTEEQNEHSIDEGNPQGAEPSNHSTDSEISANEVDTEQEETGTGAELSGKLPEKARTVSFKTDSFSVYVIVYTVDFYWEVNGKMYEFRLPGGGFVSLEHLVEVLGIATDDENPVTGAGNAENSEGKDSTAYEEAIKLNEVEISNATKKFMADVESVEFSSPELVWVERVDSASTIGGLKESNGLEVQYSAGLTEEQIGKINAQTVEAGDWALISVLPFISEEALTVTMKDGEQFVVKVTDGQISANILTSDGINFLITVTYDDFAEIPNGTILRAEEIESGTDEYLQFLGRTWAEVNRTYSETKSQEGLDDHASEVKNINVNMARFFDLKLIYQDKEIEPKAPVQVEITYTNGLLSWEDTKPGVVHFTREGTIEILEEVKTEVEGDSVVSFQYEQDSFSVVGTYIQQEMHDVETPPHVSKFTPMSPSTVLRSMGSNDIGTDAENITVPPIALRGTGEQESSYEDDNSALQKPAGNKTLVPNEDGTYTLTLSVKGRSQSVVQQLQKKANVLFVMDRSSSMITNTVSDEEQFWYYGTWNTAETTFRGDIHPGTGYTFYGVINGEYVELNTDYDYYAYGRWNTGHWDWGQYHLRYWNGSTLVDYPVNNPIYVKSKTTRLYAEQEALDEVIDNLLSYNTAETPDSVEIALISFAYRRGNLNAWAAETEHTGWVTGVGENDDLSGLLDAVDSTRYASGTNWEEALQYAYEIISAKEQAEAGKPEEDYYVIFLTDGEPTNTANAVNESPGNTDNMVSYNAARDEARNLAKYHFYNIFTYRNPSKENDIYSVYLTNYAYNQGTDPNGDRNNDYVKEYYSDAQTIDALKDKLGNIIQTVVDTIGHAGVSITDTLTTDAMTTTVVEGKTNGYVYTVKNPTGTVLYTVTATGEIDNPTVTFNVPASATKTYTATQTDVDGKKLYSITTAEGDEYRIALADIDDETGELAWDLAPVGILMNDCTYSVDFVVWPDQEAYDYVAGLNNHLEGYIWDTSSENDAYQDLTDTKGYEIGGVSRFPSIVKYPDGTFAVLTNTDQKIHYSVVEMETINGELNGEPTVHGPYYQDLETPDPMELTATETKLQKAWGVERNPSTLAQLLYDDDGNPTQFQIEYGIKILDQAGTETNSEGTGTDSEGTGTDSQGTGTDSEGTETDSEGTGTEQNKPSYYTTLTLGWDGTKYDWDPNSVRYVSLNGTSGPSVPVGTSWSKDFAIATGLMLSEARMDSLGMDKVKYGPPYKYGSTNYYILETGHDYTIEEIIPEDAPRDAYEFDFDAPTYHPMLVDGKLKSVTFNRDEENNAIVSIKEISKEDWLLSLKIENNLRGYIRLEKDIVDKDGRTPLPEDDTEFEYEIDIEDPANPGRFTGTHIPWYGVDGLFYHSIDEDDNYHYFQAETNTTDNKAHEFTLTTESGVDCPAVCIDETTGGIFDEDAVGPTLIQYVENGVTKQIRLYGNQMEYVDDNHVHAEMKINQNQVLDIANVPSKSKYTIKEVNQEGYNLVNIRREIRNNNSLESGNTYTGSATISGIIVADRDNHIIYKNKVYSVDLKVKKTDESNMPLTGAVFSLYKKEGENWPNEPVTTVPGEDEEDIAAYEFVNLADGSYKLVETPPAGYAAVDDVFFTVTNGVLSIDGTLPAGVTKDRDQLLLTVKNSPRTDSLTVRKQWLDYNGNPKKPGADEVTITLKRTVDTPTARTLKIVVNANISGQGQVRLTKEIQIQNNAYKVTWPDNGEFQWNENRLSHTNVSGVSIQDGISRHGNPSQNGNNTSAIWNISGLQNVTEDIEITFTYQSGYNGDQFLNNNGDFYNALNSGLISIEATGTPVPTGTGEPVEDDWFQIITLNDANEWKSTMTNLPADDGGGNAYHYYIVEEAVPTGYTVSYSDGNEAGVTSGVLTAYNQRTAEDVDVTVRKVWEDGINENGTPTTHQDNLVVTLSNGQSVTLNDRNHWEATITGLPRTDEEGNEIAYSWTEDELSNGYYLSDSNTVVYDNNITTTLTNSYSEHYMPEMEIDGVKIWDDDGTGNRPASITVRLYKDGVLYKTTTVNPPAGQDADPDRWTFKFTNLPVFVIDENGNATETLAVYSVEEVLPADDVTYYDTVIQQITATYEAGTAETHIINSYTPENQLVCEGADLGFVVVRHGQGYVVWTPRPLRDGELDEIKQAAVDASRQFSGIMSASGEKFTIISGVPQTVKVGNKEAATVYMKNGDVWVRFENPSAQSDIVYGSIPYNYTQIGGEGGVTITNIRKTTSVSGTKTWVDGGRQHNNQEEITLKLYRTNKPATDDSRWEEVQLTAAGAISLSWDGNTYTYSNLPRFYDYTSSPPIEYEYRVEETAVYVTEGTGAGQHTISYKMENEGNNFINTELTNIEATKTWKDAGVSANAVLTHASVTFELQKMVGDNWIKVEQEGITNPQTLSVTETADVNAWKAVWNRLPKYEKSGDNIAAIEYRVVETAATAGGQNVKPDTDPSAAVSENGKANIDNILQITINILKVDANDNTIRLGNAEFELTKVQSLETTNQVTEGQYNKTGITSDADDDTKGVLQFTGITQGYYYLHEIKAPDGYVMIESSGWHFQVDENGIVQEAGDFTADGTFQYVDAKNVVVENTPGAALPNSGGRGTTFVYLFGIMLTGLAGAGLVMKQKRRKAA